MKYNVLIDDSNENDSHTLILRKIKRGTTILEFGSANGNMTQYMKEKLDCNVYIVDKSYEDITIAKKFAVDAICDDIEKLSWLKWERIKFDYILFADVLEHIINPIDILNQTERVLKDDGVVLISIPNITHNDILIKAFNDRFDYTSTGILDNTHVHFWGRENIYEFIDKTPYQIEDINYTLWDTGSTEQAVEKLTIKEHELISILKERKYGNVYQFVFSLIKKGTGKEIGKDMHIPSNKYCRIYVSDGSEFEEGKYVPKFPYAHAFKRYKYKFDLNVKSTTKKILIKPTLGEKCVLENFNIDVPNDIKYMCIYSANINYEGIYCFTTDEPFIIIEFYELCRDIVINYTAEVILPGEEYIKYICKGCDKMQDEERNTEKQIEKIKQQLEQIICLIEALECKYDKDNLKLITQISELMNVQNAETENINKVANKSESDHVELMNKLNFLERKIGQEAGSINKAANKSKNDYSELMNKLNFLDWKIGQEAENIINIDRKMSIILGKMPPSVKNNKLFMKTTCDSDVMTVLLSYYFDWKWYTEHYNLKIHNKVKAAEHYLNIGWKLYYDPSPYFISIAYLAVNWDVSKKNINPLIHYEKYGKNEKRNIGNIEGVKEEYYLVTKSEYFDENWYRNEYNLDQNVDAVYHFLFNCLKEYLNPSIHFSSLDYLMDNIYLMGDFQNPLIHYERNKNSHLNLVVKEVNKEKKSEINNDNCATVNKTELQKLKKYNRNPVKIHNSTVDIIICVYNAYEDVKKCIESVLQNTQKPYRIIIVDDNSAELTATYLQNIADENDDILLIRNTTEFHGYTYAGNIGLKSSTADYCVMLNSDTIVSKHWLDNMIACAESDCKIGIVGPLSNTASWQSVPKLTDEDGDWCHNDIPEDFSVSEVADLIEQYSAKIYPKVPLLNGFCLMIKREVINQIGYFDEDNFGRGFAEEDDYNTRAIKAGFNLAIADDVYIFHAQSKSYTDAKRLELSKLSGESLRRKHGKDYIDNCSDFMANNRVIDGIRKRMETMYEKERIVRECRKLYLGKKILFLLPGSNASGGANVIIQESRALIKMGVDVTILNLEHNKDEFTRAYNNLEIPVIWVKDYFDFDYGIAKEYDVVVCTLFRTVEYCKFLENYKTPRIVYYIQDYEPYFIQEEIKNGDYDHAEFNKAKESYTLIPSCINVTKTKWNSDEVKKNTGADVFVLGPSLNTDLFVPRVAITNTKVVVTAMLRPSTKRRGPQMTFDVLRRLALEFEDKIIIKVFGADPEHDVYSNLFFAKQKKDFEFINYGLTSPRITSEILAESDVFLDLSEFQAMGLTAMEAMACGCATIVPQNGGTDCFAQNEKNCLVVDTLNFETCLNSAKRLIVDNKLRKRLGKQAYIDMSDLYPEKVAERFLKKVFNGN